MQHFANPRTCTPSTPPHALPVVPTNVASYSIVLLIVAITLATLFLSSRSKQLKRIPFTVNITAAVIGVCLALAGYYCIFGLAAPWGTSVINWYSSSISLLNQFHCPQPDVSRLTHQYTFAFHASLRLQLLGLAIQMTGILLLVATFSASVALYRSAGKARRRTEMQATDTG